jgi:signal transduction histidine kinase
MSRLGMVGGEFLLVMVYPTQTAIEGSHPHILMLILVNGIDREGSGLNKYDPKTNSFQVYTVRQGLPSNAIMDIQQDTKGNLWLGTKKGICKFNPQTNQIRNYTQEDGLQGNEFNKASLKSQSGDMYFGGTNGFTAFYPDSIRDNPIIPPIYLTNFQIFNKTVPIGTPDSPLQKAISETEEITLSYEQSVFSFEFAALNFSIPEKNQYVYQMENFDQDWNYVGNKRSATYTNLDPGTYVFRVKGSNNDGVWNTKGASIRIIITPPWWKTWWFRACMVIGIAGLVVGYYQRRLFGIAQQNHQLENLVNERTQELKSVNTELVGRQDEINAQNEELTAANDQLLQRQEEIALQRDLLSEQNQQLTQARKFIEEHNHTLDQEVKERTQELLAYNQQLEQFAFIAAHNLRAPVARILGLGNVLKLPNVSAEEEKMLIEKISLTTEELDTVVKDISTILEIRKDNTLTISETNLHTQLSIIRANLAVEITNTQAEIREDFSQARLVNTVKPYLDSILYNLLSNAIKYRDPARKLLIQLQTEIVGGYFCLTISDNGLGIDLKKHQKNLFSLYKRFHSHVEGKGMGLYLVKTQVAALGGKVEVESQVNMGTTFKIYLKNQTS